MNTEKQMSLGFFLSEDKWQFIKVRQPLNLQSCGTPEEMLPVEMANFKARTQNKIFTSQYVLLWLLTFQKTNKWNWNKHKDNHRKNETVCFERKCRTGHTTCRNEGQMLYKICCTKYMSVYAPQEENGNVNQQLGKEIGINSWVKLEARECSSWTMFCSKKLSLFSGRTWSISREPGDALCLHKQRLADSDISSSSLSV